MYFGSVRFFRHLIIAVVLLVLLFPFFLAVYFGIQCSVLKNELRETRQIVAELDAVTPEELENRLNNLSNSIAEKLAEIEEELSILIGGLKPVIEQSFDEKMSSRFDEFRKSTSDPMLLQIEEIQSRLDESMRLQLSDIQEQMSSEQAAKIERNLEEIIIRQQSIEEYLDYINTLIDGYIRGYQDNP